MLIPSIDEDGNVSKAKGVKMKLAVIKQLLKIGFERYNQYKVEYLYAIFFSVTTLLMVGLWYFFTGSGHTIKGWDFAHLALLSIVFNAIMSLLEMAGYYDVFTFLQTDERARLSQMLTKPIDPLLRYAFTHFYLQGILRLAIYTAAGAFIAVHYGLLHVSISFALLVLLASAIIITLFNIALLLYVAFEENARVFDNFLWAIMEVGELPLTALKGISAIIFTFILPSAFIAAVPVNCFSTECPFKVTYALIYFMIVVFLLKHVHRYVWRRFEAIGG